MWKRVARVAVIAVVSVAAIATRVRADELYRINLSPPDHVGQKFRCHVNETELSEMYRQRAGNLLLVGQQQSTIDLNAGVEVQGCDQRGMPTQLKLTVEHLWYLLPVMLPTVDPAVVKPGTEFTAHAVQVQADPPKYNDVFELKDGASHPFAQQSLRRAISIGGPIETSEQQAFGTDKPILIGGTWSLDGEPGKRLLAKLQIEAEPTHVKGTAQLVGIAKHNEVDCLEVRMTVNCDDFAVHNPSRAKFGAATAQCDLTYYLDKQTGRVVEAMYHARTDIEVNVPDGAVFYIGRSTSEITRKIQISDALKEQAQRN